MCLIAVAHASFAAARMLAPLAAPHQAPRTEPRGPASSATLQQRLVLLALFTCTGSLYVQTCFPPLARSKCGSEGTRARDRDGWPFRAASHSCIASNRPARCGSSHHAASAACCSSQCCWSIVHGVLRISRAHPLRYATRESANGGTALHVPRWRCQSRLAHS